MSRYRKPAGAGVTFEPVVSTTQATCIRCLQPFVARGVVMTVWMAGERLGFIGDCCLNPKGREELRQRAEAQIKRSAKSAKPLTVADQPRQAVSLPFTAAPVIQPERDHEGGQLV